LDKIEFSKEKIEKENLIKILEAGWLSPTAKNLQPQKIYVVETNKSIEKLKKATNNLHEANTVIIVCADRDEAYIDNHYTSYNSDAILVTLNMILEATRLGIDNMWIKNFNEDIIQKEFEIEEKVIPVSLILLGYKTDDSIGFTAKDFNKELPVSQRKKFDEIVKYL